MWQKIKISVLFISIIIGIVLHGFLSALSPIVPYLLFAMLFISFCKVDIKSLKITKLHWFLAAFQIIVGYISYFSLRNFDEIVAQGVMSCILAPTACAAVVVAGILGASVASVTSYTLLINLLISFFGPLLFTITNGADYSTFFTMFFQILLRIFPVLVLPMVVAFFCKKVTPPISNFFAKRGTISFFIWIIVVTIVIAKTTSFILQQESPNYRVEIIMAVASLFLCLLQFYLGRIIGAKNGDSVAGGQSLGQKNTALMLWMVLSYLDPIASVACAAYVVWQNLVNAYQMWQFGKKSI